MMALHQLQGAGRPARPERRRQRLQNAALLGGGKFRQDRYQPRLLVLDQTDERQRQIRGLESGTARQEIIAPQDQLESERRVQALVARGHVLDRGYDRLELRFRPVEFAVKFDDLFQRRHLLLRLPGLVEKFDQLVRPRDFLAAELDRFALLRRDGKISFLVQEFLRRVPPAFPFRLGENVAEHHLADLRDRGGTAEALENVSHQRDRIFFDQLLDPRKVGRLFRQKVRRWDDGQVFRRVGKLHRVRLFPREID